MKKIIYLLPIFFACLNLSAQEISRYEPKDFDKEKNYGYFNYVHFRYERGAHPSGTNYLQDIFAEGYDAITLRVGAQSTGRKSWQQLHNYPQYGLGVAWFDLGGYEADSIIGSPLAVFFYFGAPIFRYKKIRFNADLELGLSYNFKPYDSETNPYQDVIGATTNLHFNMSFLLYYELSQRIDLSLGLGLSHFSNGRSFTPQKGVNLMGLSLGAAYHFNPVKNYTKHIEPNYQPPIRPEFIKTEKPAFKPHHELQFLASIGTVQAEPGEAKDSQGESDTTGAEGPRYGVSSFAVDYAYQVARKVKLVTGFDFFYDGSAEFLYSDILPQETTFSDKAFYGYHVGFHYLIERFAFIGNVGWYIHKPFEQRGKYYMRGGGKIGLTPDLDVHVCLKTRNGGIADWIEWGFSYKFRLN